MIHRYVIANDLSPSATAAMKRNVDINGLGTPVEDVTPEDNTTGKAGVPKLGKVRINEGDAW
jgi:tRNA (guanine26-N2/guanine27-N2)-dimethyltransferase